MRRTHFNAATVFISPQDAKKVLQQQLRDLREQRLSIQQAMAYCRHVGQFKPKDERVGFEALAQEYQAILDSFFDKPFATLPMEKAA